VVLFEAPARPLLFGVVPQKTIHPGTPCAGPNEWAEIDRAIE
jgi:hypothetical protein